jgi:2-keto-4-pentenoate hydratase/2-oxohepta-3-ene-1,7-dioic acid hydratase in catechol pathway
MIFDVIRFNHDGRTGWGVLERGRIRVVPGEFATTADFLRNNSHESLGRLGPASLEESAVEVLSPITRNQQLVCQGANYRSHMIESGLDPDEKNFNMIFRKASSSIVSATSEVVRPAHVRLLDYEVELGLVLGADVTSHRTFTNANLHEVVAGVVIVNDYSARDVQIPEMQFYKGKSYRTFAPVGPRLCLLGKEDLPRLESLRMKLTVNGRIRQDASTAEIVFGPAETLTELSSIQDLFTGDLIATGTPAGCALRVPPKIFQKAGALLSDRARFRLFVRGQAKRSEYLQPGDVVEATIRSEDGLLDLGTQRNRIVTESP